MAALAVLAGGSDVALGSPSDTILTATIYKPGAQPTTESITSGSLESRSQQCVTYGKNSMDEYGLDGRPEPQQFGATTWPLGTILACLQPPVPPALATGGVTVFREDGSPESGTDSTLSSADLTPPGTGFNHPDETPVITDLGTSMRYDRPWRGGSDEDFLDQVLESAPIAVAVFEGNRIPVTASASPATISQGGTVSFTASASGPGLSYQWSFGGGAPASTQQNPQVTFSSAGVWTVSLLVTDSNGDAGHDQLTETVTSSAVTTPTTPGTVTTGPSNSTGTTPGGAAGTGPGQHGPPSTKPKTHPTGTNHQPSRTKTTQHKTTTNQTSTTPTTPSTGGSRGSGSGGGVGSGGSGSSASGSGSSGAGSPATATTPTTSTHASPPTKTPPHPTRPAPPLPGVPRLVTGQLVSDIVPVPESTSPLVHAEAAALPAIAPALHPPSRPSVLPIIASVLAVLVLLAAGAARELQGRRPWRRPWPRFGV